MNHSQRNHYVESTARAARAIPVLRTVMSGALPLLLLMAAFAAALKPAPANDFWWQARTGGLILEQGRIPQQDPFSWTSAGERWFVHEWLTEIFFYLAHARWGDGWLLLYRCGFLAAAAGLIYLRCRRRGAGLAAATLAAAPALLVLRNYADLRPQMVSYFLIALLLLLLDDSGCRPPARLILVLGLLFALWANLHGGVVVGVAILWIWLLGEWVENLVFRKNPAPRGLTLAALAASAAVLLNPDGWNIYLYPFKVMGHPLVLDYITEWFSPSFHRPVHRPFLLLLLATPCAALLSARVGGRTRTSELLTLAALAYGALLIQRNTVAFAIAAAPPLAVGLSLLARFVIRRSEAAAAAAPAASLAVMLLVPALLLRHVWPGAPPNAWMAYSAGYSRFPAAAAARLKQGEWPGRLYNDYVWGGYLIWHLYPQRKVFIDGRAEIYYRSGAFDSEITIHRVNRGWRRELDRWRIDVVLTNRNERLASALSMDPAWALAFTGPVEAVFIRRFPAPGEAPPHPNQILPPPG